MKINDLYALAQYNDKHDAITDWQQSMQDISWYLRRLRSMEPAEILWRIRSLFRDQVDLVRIPLGLMPGLGRGAVGSFDDFEPGFRCSPVDKATWKSLPDGLRSQWGSKLLEKADGILENKLSYFDLENQFHGDPWNWHRDFSAGKDCPVRLSILTDYRDFKTNGDCKLVWEPNRHHQLVVLGRAYAVTGAQKYALKVAELLRSWIDANPFGYGMNWKSPLELGVRLINWVWALDLIRGSDAIDDKLWYDIVNTIYRAMWDTQRKYSRGSSANNHLIGELAGVYIACCYFPQMPNADPWRETARKLLEREIIAQTFADGCTREHAFNYEFFVIQFFTASLLAGQEVGDSFSHVYRDRMHAMYRFMHDLSSDTGRPPNAGDADDGYVLDLGNLPSQPLPLLAVGEIIFDDAELTFDEPSESAFWLFGRDALTSTTPVPRNDSSFYPASGYFILRSGPKSDTGSPAISVFFDCAELGYGPIAAHGHADCLSFCLSVDGIPVLIDPGTYDYFSHPEWREYFRQTRAHNTVEINNVSQSQPLGPFMWGTRGKNGILDFAERDNDVTVTGTHDGYQRLSCQLTHQRRISLHGSSRTVKLEDTFLAKGNYTARLAFHVAPGWAAHSTETGATLTNSSGGLEVQISVANLSPIDASVKFDHCWASSAYHVRTHCAVVRITIPCTDISEIKTIVRINTEEND